MNILIIDRATAEKHKILSNYLIIAALNFCAVKNENGKYDIIKDKYFPDTVAEDVSETDVLERLKKYTVLDPTNISSVDKAWERIRLWCKRIPLDAENVVNHADLWIESKRRDGWGEYMNYGGLLEGEVVPVHFWEDYETIRNIKVPDEFKENFFTCSC
jgi:hypothetical protein